MTIWRGEGGGGDATTDSEINFITSLTNSIAGDTIIASNAATSATASASSAATSASNANVSAIAASSSASAASGSASVAFGFANDAASSYDSFDDRYLGSKTVAPTLDNDGNTLLVGALYWNSVTTKLFVWSGTAWRDGFFTGLSSSLVTATAGQTVVSTPTYTVGTNTIQVYVNGLKVILGTDFTETSTTSITFASGLTLGDEVELLVVQSLTIGTAAASNVSYTPTGTIAATNVQNALSEIISDLAASSGSSLVGYLPSGTGAVATTVQTKLRESVSVKDFGADPTGVTSSSTAIQNAINSGASVITYPAGTYLLSTSVTLASFQTHKGNGAIITGAGTIFTTAAGATQQIVIDGLIFAGTGNAIYQSGIYLNSNWQIKNCSFARSLNECVYISLILSQIENNYFGTNSGASGAQHRHLCLRATQASGAAINQNLIKGNRFNFAVGTHSIFIQYGSGNTFIANDFENNSCRAVHLDGAGVTNFIGNWIESNNSTYQVYAECSATITLSLYYNKAINFIGNNVNTLNPNSTAIFYLDANSYCLSMTGNLIYSNNPTVGGTPTYVTQTPAGNNWGIVQYQNNSNYGSYITDTTGGLLTGVAITGIAGQFSCAAGTTPLVVGQALRITGTFGGTGSITGYSSGTVYYLIATNGSTTFTLSTTIGGAAITTTAGTPTGLTYTLGVGSTYLLPNMLQPVVVAPSLTVGGINSSAKPFQAFSTTNADMGYINNTGIWSTGTFTNSPYNYTTASAANMVVLSNGQLQRSTSALKYKTDVRDLESIDIAKFRPVRYKSKGMVDNPDTDHFGLIADEVDAMGIKELVSYGANGEVEGFAYERLTVVLLKKLQELSAEFGAYKAAHP